MEPLVGVFWLDVHVCFSGLCLLGDHWGQVSWYMAFTRQSHGPRLTIKEPRGSEYLEVERPDIADSVDSDTKCAHDSPGKARSMRNRLK